jgi:hypothetical protein
MSGTARPGDSAYPAESCKHRDTLASAVAMIDHFL